MFFHFQTTRKIIKSKSNYVQRLTMIPSPSSVAGVASSKAELWEIIRNGRKLLQALESFAAASYPHDDDDDDDDDEDEDDDDDDEDEETTLCGPVAGVNRTEAFMDADEDEEESNNKDDADEEKNFNQCRPAASNTRLGHGAGGALRVVRDTGGNDNDAHDEDSCPPRKGEDTAWHRERTFCTRDTSRRSTLRDEGGQKSPPKHCPEDAPSSNGGDGVIIRTSRSTLSDEAGQKSPFKEDAPSSNNGGDDDDDNDHMDDDNENDDAVVVEAIAVSQECQHRTKNNSARRHGKDDGTGTTNGEKQQMQPSLETLPSTSTCYSTNASRKAGLAPQPRHSASRVEPGNNDHQSRSSQPNAKLSSQLGKTVITQPGPNGKTGRRSSIE
jgi:hypothetical protein